MVRMKRAAAFVSREKGEESGGRIGGLTVSGLLAGTLKSETFRRKSGTSAATVPFVEGGDWNQFCRAAQVVSGMLNSFELRMRLARQSISYSGSRRGRWEGHVLSIQDKKWGIVLVTHM